MLSTTLVVLPLARVRLQMGLSLHLLRRLLLRLLLYVPCHLLFECSSVTFSVYSLSSSCRHFYYST